MNQIFKKNPKQVEASQLLSGPATHIMLEGGGRSGKTLLLCKGLVVRSLKTKSRHVILRKHFNHVKQAIWYDTMLKVFDLCYPGMKGHLKFDKSDWFIQFPNTGSEIWFGGLDDKERTEKILGKEFSTIYFNECSEISWDARNIALTRLAEKNSLKKRVYYDQNPPKMSHWTHDLFHKKVQPGSAEDKPLPNPDDYVKLLMNPEDNIDNIDENYISGVLMNLPPKLQLRFWKGQYGTDDTDVFQSEWVIPSSPKPVVGDKDNPGDIAAVFMFVDPAYTEKSRATDNTCESGIVVVGVDYDSVIHELECQHGMWAYQDLKNKCKAVYDKYSFIPSHWFGVEDIAAQRWLMEDLIQMGVTCVGEKPDNDKTRRAMSVTDLMSKGRCRINDPALRKQVLGFPGEKLKDLVDAYVYCLRMVKRYSEDQYNKPDDKYKHLSENDKQFWMDYDKEIKGEEDMSELIIR